MSNPEPTPNPKTSETDPPAADRPVDESPGSPEQPPPEPQDAAGRAANDPSASGDKVVPETAQVPRGKPDGEVATGRSSGSSRTA